MSSVRLTPADLKLAVPELRGTVGVRGPGAPVEILRDRLGVPHVRATSTWDAFFGQGFVHAQDRLWHMEFDRRRAYGRWAELAGAGAVAGDVLMRRFRLAATARQDYAQVGEETRAMFEAYAAGVNAFIETTARLPVEFTLLGISPEPWQAWDGLATYKLRHVMMGVWEAKLFRGRLLAHAGPEAVAALYPGTPPDELIILPPGAEYAGVVASALDELTAGLAAVQWLREPTGTGSNNWAVHGSRTASGRPLLAGDPHREVDTPNVYYQNHVACPDFDVIGLSLPGLPGFPHFGHNQRVAWCITHTGADTQDLFVEQFDRDQPDRYRFQGQWLAAQVERQSVAVRGGEPVEIDVISTHHGPIIAGDPGAGYALALRYTATLEGNSGWDCLLPMLTSTASAQLEEAMEGWVDPVNNLLFADVDGAIGYRTRGLVPVRHRRNAWVPVPGWTGEHEWTGFIPFAEMPRLRNPKKGYLVTANNQVTGPDYPHYIGNDFVPDDRARRISERFLARRGVGPDDMAAIHADVVSLPARRILGTLHLLKPASQGGKQAKTILAAWDGSVRADQAAPAIYNALREELVLQVLRPMLGRLRDHAFAATGRGGPTLVARLRNRLMRMVVKGDTSLLPARSDWSKELTRALEAAVAKLQQQLGDDPRKWRWGDLHRLRPRHPLADVFPEAAPLLNPPESPMDGDGDTVQAAGYLPGTGYAVSITAVARYVFDLSDWEKSAWVVPHGVSGHPGSRHCLDQHQAWLEHRLLPMTYDWQRIALAAESRQVLQPEV